MGVTGLGHEGHKGKALVVQLTGQGNALAHGEGSHHGADAQALDMAQEHQGQYQSSGQAGHVKADLDPGVGDMGQGGQLPGEQVGGG